MVTLFTPKQVAQAIGVSESSLKRWCDKGALATRRTAGGHRRITAEGVIQFLRSTGQPLVEAEILGLPSNVGRGELVVERAQQELLDALLSGDEVRCRRVIFDLYLARHSVSEIGDRLIADTLHHIGHQWESGRIEVYRERRACEIVLRALHELRQVLPAVNDDAPLAIGGTVEGDPYQVATTIVELVLREAGWRATSLGTGLPIDTLCAAMRDLRPELVWLSVSYLTSVDAFVADFHHLYEEATARHAAVVVGGRALTHDLRTRITYSAYCDNFRHVAAAAQSIAAARSAPAHHTDANAADPST